MHDRLNLLLRPRCIYSTFLAQQVSNNIAYPVKVMRLVVWFSLACFFRLLTSADPTTSAAVVAASAADDVSKDNVARK